MPTYQYACTACDHRFETVQAFTEDSLTECPQCTGKLRKLYGSVGVVFKGSGFYRTDSRAETSKGSNGSSSPAKTGSGDGGSGSDSGSASPAPDSSSSSASGGSGDSKPASAAPSSAPTPSTAKTGS